MRSSLDENPMLRYGFCGEFYWREGGMRRFFVTVATLTLLAAQAPVLAQDGGASGEGKIENWDDAELAGAGILRRIQQFVVNPSRTDPYKRINFRVKWDGRVIPGISFVSPISRRTAAIQYREGGDLANQRTTPGLTTILPVTLRRGVAHDPAFETWADQVWNPASAGAVSLKDYRKNVSIELVNLSGQVVKRYLLYRCWPTEYTALSALNAAASAKATETLIILCDAWERDKDVVEPEER